MNYLRYTPYRYNSFPGEGNEEGDFTLKEKIQYTLLGVVVIGGSILIGRKLVKNAKANNEERKTFEDNSPAGYAKQLKMAFENDNPFGWGTDEEAIRRVMRSVTSKDEFKKVMSSYEKLYSSSLMRDLKEELSATEYNEMLAILSAKPDNAGAKIIIGNNNYLAWARRLKAAFDITYWMFPGTDENAVKAVFMELPTQLAYTDVAKAYKNEYSRDLTADLKDELTTLEYISMMKLLSEKPKA